LPIAGVDAGGIGEEVYGEEKEEESEGKGEV
jgi:hypothetical protein